MVFLEKDKSIYKSEVLKALKAIYDPDLQEDIVSLDLVKNLTIGEGVVTFTIQLTNPACPVKESSWPLVSPADSDKLQL